MDTMLIQLGGSGGDGNQRSQWPPSCTDMDGNRHEDMCPRPECDLVDRFWTFAKFCRCGNPHLALQQILDGLRAHPVPGERTYAGEWVDANLPLAYMFETWGLTEHGSSVYGAWLTPDGIALRDALAAVDFATVLHEDHNCNEGQRA